MPRTFTERQYNAQVRKAKAGWAKYFAELESNQERDIIYYEQVKYLPVEGMTDFAQQQIGELLIKLKASIDCPVCLETIAPDQIEMTACGHKFCKSCLSAIKERPEPKCAICRGKIWVKK